MSLDVWDRPDGRRFVFGAPDGETLPAGELYASMREGEEEPWLGHGFSVWRREDEFEIPTRPAGPHTFLTLAEVNEDRLRLLDDELRGDTPGSDGWRWPPADFHEETYSSPSVYLVAGEYAGLCRVWLDRPVPRLGFIGVRREQRGRGLARTLVAAALGDVRALGHSHVTAEVNETNIPSQALVRGFGARRIGGYVELVRPTP